MKAQNKSQKVSGLSKSTRYILGAICLLILFCLLYGAASIPFIYESQSIRYKFGIEKSLLRTGKVFGLLAGTLLLFQLVLSSRLKILSQIFTLKTLNRTHQLNARLLAFLALSHPLLVFASENITSLPIEIKYWPEIVGAFLLLLIWILLVTATWRVFLNFQFKSWQLFHRIGAFTAAVLLGLHVLFVSDTFSSGLPKTTVLTTLFIYAALWLFIRIRNLRHP